MPQGVRSKLLLFSPAIISVHTTITPCSPSQLVPRLQERQAAEAKRLKATERVARRLGEPSLYGDEPGGRSRRERRAVNYAFTDYDDMLRSAIRRSQRSGETGDEFLEEGRRGKRGVSLVGGRIVGGGESVKVDHNL